MIRISYNDFMPNSGNVSLDSVQDKLQELFLADNEVPASRRGCGRSPAGP